MTGEIAGRKREKEALNLVVNSQNAEFIAVYGRRRVGKTFLIEEYCSQKGFYFSCTGIKGATLKEQIDNFTNSLSKYFFNNVPIKNPKNWSQAFKLLTSEILKIKNATIILFFDELPWFSSKKSKFIQSLDHTWNTEWRHLPQLKLIVCGSAASWMLENLIHAKGGLHNRITKRIHLEPFHLAETSHYITSKKLTLNNKQILDIFMAMGGIPYYLNQLLQGKSAQQNINEICFSKNGILIDEYERLLASLFDGAEMHEKILKELFKKKSGLTKEEIATGMGLSSGGTLVKKIQELEESGFIQPYSQYGYEKKLTYYKIIDEYILFYFYWIEKVKTQIKKSNLEDYWLKIANTNEYHAWAGLAFEVVCHKHSHKIAEKLGIQNIDYKVSSWRYLPKKGAKEKGAQIDLIFDRSDGIISLVEIKYSSEIYLITKEYAENLKNKIEIFSQKIKTKKQIVLEFVSVYGLQRNIWSEGLVHNVVTLEDLFGAKG